MFLPPPPPPPPDGGGLTPVPESSRGGVLEGGSPAADFKRKTLVDMKLLDSGCLLLYTEHRMPEKERNLQCLWCQDRDKCTLQKST